ncbi:MAG TPA: type VI secretion system protein TssA [Smithellaceae bacterium]|nr:type VI secretion system protein TssA [Smithellaceae bacterium]
MKKQMDMDALMTPVPGDNPAGEDQRYSPVYDEIREARKEVITYDPEGHPTVEKKAEWNKVITLSLEALTQKTKDLQIAVWLTEALLMTENFEGFNAGLKIINGLLAAYWENLYPSIEDDDLEFRAAPLEFMNEKFISMIKSQPVTDSKAGEVISYQQWQESQTVGYDSDVLDKYGDVDNSKKQRRDELIAEGKMTADQVDGIVAKSSVAFYESLARHLVTSKEEMGRLDQFVDEKFGRQAPRLSDLDNVIDDYQRVVFKLLETKGGVAPGKAPAVEEEPTVSEAPTVEEDMQPLPAETPMTPMGEMPSKASVFMEPRSNEDAIWQSALAAMKKSGVKSGLGQLLAASNSSSSPRDKYRYRLLMAKLCLKAGRPELARPIIEELYALMEELHLERWESPIWISEVIDAYYQCMMKGEPSDDDMAMAKALFHKLCTLDVTKAIPYGQ